MNLRRSRDLGPFCPTESQERFLASIKYRLKMEREGYIDCCWCQKVCPMQLSANEIVEKAGLHQLRKMHRGLPKEGIELLILKRLICDIPPFLNMQMFNR